MWVASLHLAIGQPDSQSGMDWTGHLVNSFWFSLSLVWLSHRDAGLPGPYFPSLKHSGFCQPPGNCKKTPGPASYPLVLLYLQLQDGGFFVCVCFYFCSCLFVWLFLTAQALLTWTGILNTCWELALHEHHTYQWPHPCCLPGSMDCTLEGTPGFHTAPGMCTGCSPVLHPVTTPTFPTVHFSHLFKTLLAACRNTQCSATCKWHGGKIYLW